MSQASRKRTKKVLRKDLDAALELLRDQHATAARLTSSLGTLIAVAVVLALEVGVICAVMLLVL